MEEPTNLQDWELLSSDSDDLNSFAFDDIIHSDYFALDSNKPHHQNHPKNDDEALKNFDAVDPNDKLGIEENNKGGSFIEDDSKMGVGFDGITKGESFQTDDSKTDLGFEGTDNSDVVDSEAEVGVQESEKGCSFIVDDPKMEVGFEGIDKGESFQADDSIIDLGFERNELGVQESKKGGSFLAGDPKMEVGIEEIDSVHQNSDEAGNMKELVSHSSMCNSGSVPVGGGEKKVLIWWKLPLDILKLCVSRMRTAWSVPIAAAFIGILMVGRKLYKMKHKSRIIPLIVSFEDKKTVSRILLHTARLNEVVVRRVPVIRSPLLPAGGVTPWPAVGQL